MPIFEVGQHNLTANNGWIVGHFIKDGARKTSDVEVKLAHHSQGPAGQGWSNCRTGITLSILISGRFQIEFRNAPIDVVEMHTPGQYVIFGPEIPHRSTALEDSLFLTVRWPSKDMDCRPV